MKTINVTFTDEEYKKYIFPAKDVSGINWHDFLIAMCEWYMEKPVGWKVEERKQWRLVKMDK